MQSSRGVDRVRDSSRGRVFVLTTFLPICATKTEKPKDKWIVSCYRVIVVPSYLPAI